LIQGDITKAKVDAITNAANQGLQHIGGIAFALSEACGPSLQKESNEKVKEKRVLDEGTVTVTGAGFLERENVKHIFHAIGPMWHSSNSSKNIETRQEVDLLKKTVLNVLEFGESYRCRSIAIPAISSGIFGFPKRLCAKIMFDTFESFTN
jgi:O-acetyl-ADP-ribose deacetylase (regulator of RNase III)